MVIADVSKEEDCKEIVNVAADKLGGIDILIQWMQPIPLHPSSLLMAQNQ